jgi:large subunit ribosomal protein L29
MKASDFRDMAEVELHKTLEDKKEALFNLRFQKAKKTLENLHSIRLVKRDIARILTILDEKSKQAEKTKKVEG